MTAKSSRLGKLTEHLDPLCHPPTDRIPTRPPRILACKCLHNKLLHGIRIFSYLLPYISDRSMQFNCLYLLLEWRAEAVVFVECLVVSLTFHNMLYTKRVGQLQRLWYEVLLLHVFHPTETYLCLIWSICHPLVLILQVDPLQPDLNGYELELRLDLRGVQDPWMPVTSAGRFPQLLQ